MSTTSSLLHFQEQIGLSVTTFYQQYNLCGLIRKISPFWWRWRISTAAFFFFCLPFLPFQRQLEKNSFGISCEWHSWKDLFFFLLWYMMLMLMMIIGWRWFSSLVCPRPAWAGCPARTSCWPTSAPSSPISTSTKFLSLSTQIRNWKLISPLNNNSTSAVSSCCIAFSPSPPKNHNNVMILMILISS